MHRISLYSLFSYMLISITYTSEYFDLSLVFITILSLFQLIFKKRFGQAVIILFFAYLALLNCNAVYYQQNADFEGLSGKNVSLTCVVCDTPSYSNDSIQFTAETKTIIYRGKEVRANGKIIVFSKGNNTQIDYGDKISLKAVIK